MPHAAGLWYEWHGPEDGEVLILSPGLGGSATYWQPNLAALSARYRLLLYDHRGTGRSDPVLPDTMTVDDLADDVLALMDALEIERTHLVGHAAGGVAGLALARNAPARLNRLVVVNGWIAADPHFLRCFEARLNLLRHSGVEAFLRAQPIFLYPAQWISSHDGELNAELPRQLASFPGVGNVEKRIAALAAFDATRWVAALRTPIMTLCAYDDMLVPYTCSLEFQVENPAICHRGLEFGGHACNVTYPDNFNRIVLGWLAGEVPEKD
jgi:aminoacrylate hydrolase